MGGGGGGGGEGGEGGGEGELWMREEPTYSYISIHSLCALMQSTVLYIGQTVLWLKGKQ